ncbi:MAG TPA: FAD-dependent oxidoreductase [Solirubrobacteraceae bacterium]|nr:FAD-dependent oxidoreductase [Solirubrobacteraceae bacterium]
MRIAVVGAGVSGLVAAHLLAREHEVTVFEAQAYAGGHTNTVRVDTPHETHWVDTGFIVFNDRNYPRFERLLDRLGVGGQPSDMSFAVTDEAGDFEYASTSPNGLFAKRAHLATPWFHRMVADLLRFQREARALLASDGDGPSLGHFLEERRYSRAFVDRLIVPQAAAVWSADPRQMWSFPARFLIEFFANHGMLGFRDRPKWRTVAGGSHRYVEALTAPWRDRLRLSTPVERITRHPGHVTVTPRGHDAERFDHVVLATHSDQALKLLADPSPREHELLAAIPYQANEAVLHTDARMLPRRRRAWASWNYHLLEEPTGKPTVTYHMNRLQSLDAEREFCVTLNRTEAIDPGTIIRTIPYAHPVYTADGQAAQARHAEISGENRTHYCGAYWGWGFHEDGVVSGERVATRLGAAGL